MAVSRVDGRGDEEEDSRAKEKGFDRSRSRARLRLWKQTLEWKDCRESKGASNRGQRDQQWDRAKVGQLQ